MAQETKQEQSRSPTSKREVEPSSSAKQELSSSSAAKEAQTLRDKLRNQRIDPARDKAINAILGPDASSSKGVSAQIQQNQLQEVARTTAATSKQERSSPNRSQNHRHDHHHDEGQLALNDERQDQVAFRYVGTRNQPQQSQKQKNKDAWSNSSDQLHDGFDPGGQDLQHREALEGPTVSTMSTNESSLDSSTDASSEHGSAHTGGLDTTPGEALGTEQEIVKLLDLVGPDAIITLRERLQEVWVQIDEQAALDLDVLARLPAGLNGESSMELLMVESPQSVHFLAFLKNRNDFEVLGTFDRRDLLPQDPTQQLGEAAIIAYTQTAAVLEEAERSLAAKVTELAEERDDAPMIFEGVRQQWVASKRRLKKLRGLIDQLNDRLEELPTAEDFLTQRETIDDMPVFDDISEIEDISADEEGPIRHDLERPVLENPEDS